MEISKLAAVKAFPKTFKGDFDSVKGVTQKKLTSIKISSPEPILVQTDGEIIGTTPARVWVEPGALRFCYPFS